MSKPLVSVIVTTYNQENYIAKALDSILMQKCDFSLEIIISDDASTDNTPNIISSYQKKHPNIIRVILNSQNLGISKNWFNALVSAKGEYVTTLEGDDYWLSENKLQIQFDFLQKNTQYIGVSCDRIIVDDNGIEYDFFTTAYKSVNRKNSIKSFLNGTTFSYTACLHKNFFKQNPQQYASYVTHNNHIADFALCCILLNQGNVFVLPNKLSAYRISGNTQKQQSYTSSTSFIQRYQDSIDTINISKQFFNNKYNFNKCLSVWSFVPFTEAIFSKQLPAFLSIFNQTPLSVKLWCIYTWPAYCLKAIKFKISRAFKK